MSSDSPLHAKVSNITIASASAMLLVFVLPFALLGAFPTNETLRTLFGGFRFLFFTIPGIFAVHFVEKLLLQRRNRTSKDAKN